MTLRDKTGKRIVGDVNDDKIIVEGLHFTTMKNTPICSSPP